MNIEDLWKKTKKNIENSISPTSYDSWIKNLELIGFDDSTSTLTLSTNNMISINIIEKRLLHSMKTSAKEVFEQDINIKIEYRENKRTKNKIKDSNKGDFDILFEENILNPKYTFDNFVVGDNNRHAHADGFEFVRFIIGNAYTQFFFDRVDKLVSLTRSEERRVGKECRSRCGQSRYLRARLRDRRRIGCKHSR